MFKKIILSFYCCLPFGGWALSSQNQEELKAIDQQIQEIKARLQGSHLEEMKEEVEGQGYMIADWEKYSQEIQEIRKQIKEDDQLKKQMDSLTQRRRELMKQQSLKGS